MSETTKYLVTGATANFYEATNLTKEEDGTIVIERVNWAGTCNVRVLPSPNNKVYELREIA